MGKKFKHDKGGPYPLETELKAGKYKWCTCGATKKPPFCDGTCKGDKPLKFELKKKAKVRLCNCGLTKTAPYCDDKHLCAADSKKDSKKAKKK